MKTLFVTGAEGFSGTCLVELFRSKGYDVVGGVRNRARKLAFEKKYGKALVCEVSDSINVARAIASVRPDGIIHLAGSAQAHRANAEPLTAYQTIVSAWANVLDAARRSVPRARILLVSGCDVYGSAGNDGRPISENVTLQPVNTFGALKATAESIARTFHRNYHLNLSIARPFHFTGAGQSTEFFLGSVANRILNWDTAASGSNIELPDLDCRRDILHVQDVAAAYAELLENGRPNETYNVCSGHARSVREICEAIAGQGHQHLSFSSPADEETAPVASFCGDATKIREHTGWQPKLTFEQAIRDLAMSQAPAVAPVASLN